jgi:DNA-binding transcriptional LysR family regulator
VLINYSLLPTLLALGSGRTFTEAAKRLRLTPSAISHQMRTLEAQLGVRLFERVGRRTQLTAEAIQLIGVIEEHVPPIEAALESLVDDGMNVRGLIRIGGILPFSRVWLRPKLKFLLHTYRELSLELSFGIPSILVGRLISGQLDFAIVAEDVDCESLASAPIFAEELWAVCTTEYLAGRNAPETADDFEKHDLIIYDQGRPMHEIWWRASFGKQEPNVERIVCAVANLDEMLYLVESHFGIAVLPDYLVADAVARGTLVRVGPRQHKGPKNNIYVAWRKSAIETSRFKVLRKVLTKAD